jgi:putative membrane protein
MSRTEDQSAAAAEPKEDIRVAFARIRTDLANRRTFLAWCRTSLGLMAFGFVLEKVIWFFKAEHMEGHARTLREFGLLGGLSFVMGGFLIMAAWHRYLSVARELGMSHPLSMLPEILMTLTVVGVMVVAVLFAGNILQ